MSPGVSALPRDLARKGELVARVRVSEVVFEVGSTISTVLAEDVMATFTAQWKTRPAPSVGDEYDVWRMGAGEVYAVGQDGDRHQLSSMTSSGVPRDPRPFGDPPADLVQAAHQEAEELGLRLEFRATGVTISTPRGDIQQHFIQSWRETLRAAGLPGTF
jgi:hypothetical protein